MTNIKITNLTPAGSELLAGGESFLTELQDTDTSQINGGYGGYGGGGGGGYGGGGRGQILFFGGGGKKSKGRGGPFFFTSGS